MATQTPNLNLDLREASDIFNPLSTNSNFETLDTVISDIQKKGGIVTYTTTASANLLKLSGNPTPNDTVFKFVAAGDANTWSYQETVNNIVALDGKQKTVKAGELYVAWVNAANAMVVIAWPDVVNAQTFDGKGPAEWATKAQLDAVNQTAANATQTAQAAATVANQALEAANAGTKFELVAEFSLSAVSNNQILEVNTPVEPKALAITFKNPGENGNFGKASVFIGIKSGISETVNVLALSSDTGLGSFYFAGRQFIVTPGSPKTLLTMKNGPRVDAGSSSVRNDSTVMIPEKVFALY